MLLLPCWRTRVPNLNRNHNISREPHQIKILLANYISAAVAIGADDAENDAAAVVITSDATPK